MTDPTILRFPRRAPARVRLLGRFRDEQSGTAHGRFILWVSPPAPPGRIVCTAACTGPGPSAA